jgi:hypothetical protein
MRIRAVVAEATIIAIILVVVELTALVLLRADRGSVLTSAP